MLEDSFEEPSLLRWVKGPDGRMELLDLPLTRELFLDPQLGDTMTQGEWHDLTVHEITDILRNHFRWQPDVRVFREMKHYLMPGRPAPAPDVSVIRGLRPRRGRTTFRVKREGVRPSLSETTGIWFQVSPDGERIYLFEDPTGHRLLNMAEQEDRAEREAAARKIIEERTLREAEACKAAEEKVASAEAEIERLRAEIERLRGMERESPKLYRRRSP